MNVGKTLFAQIMEFVCALNEFHADRGSLFWQHADAPHILRGVVLRHGVCSIDLRENLLTF